MKDVLLSIIVPVYNIEKYIGECLNTLIDQNINKDKYEIIVVDDGSTDKSGDIIDVYGNNYQNVCVYHQQNGGVSSARNKALSCAKGKYVWFVDGDDFIVSNVLSELIQTLELNDFPDLLSFNVQSFEEGETPDINAEILQGKGSEEYKDWIVTWFIKRKLIEDNKIRFDENIFFAEDDIFQVFVDRCINTRTKVDKVVYFYRQRQGSALHSGITDNNFIKYVKSYSASLKYAEEYDFFWYKRDMVYKAMPYLMCFIAEKPYFKAKEYIKQLKKYGLFPLPQYTYEDKEKFDKPKSTSTAKKIRDNSYNLSGYLVLRMFLKFIKIKKIFK